MAQTEPSSTWCAQSTDRCLCRNEKRSQQQKKCNRGKLNKSTRWGSWPTRQSVTEGRHSLLLDFESTAVRDDCASTKNGQAEEKRRKKRRLLNARCVACVVLESGNQLWGVVGSSQAIERQNCRESRQRERERERKRVIIRVLTLHSSHALDANHVCPFVQQSATKRRLCRSRHVAEKSFVL